MQNKIGINYRTIIGRELEVRKRRSSGYSLRAFARDLKIPAPKLSQILSGTCGMSRDRAIKISTSMGLCPDEKDLFITLVEAEHSRSPIDRKRAQDKLEKLKEADDFDPLSIERFKIISDWYHTAILELPKLKNFKSAPKWISERLGIKKNQVTSAIERLVDFGLLEEDPESFILKRTKNHLATPSGIPSREIREHHSQILSKADRALELSVAERDFSTITMAIDSSRLEEAKEKLKEFRRDFCKEIQSGQEKDRIYCLAIQFFPLDKEPK